jgi:predicted alpha/beta hydrolase
MPPDDRRPSGPGQLLLTPFGTAAGEGPRLLVLPALGTPARAYSRVCESLAGLGFGGAVLEWPGAGLHPVRADRSTDWGYRELLERQTLPALDTLADQGGPGPARVVLLAHSLGAHVALMARARGHRALAGIVTIAAGSPYSPKLAPSVRLGLVCLRAAVALSTGILGYYPGHRLGFGGRQPRTLMREWARFAGTGRLSVERQEVLRGPAEGPDTVPVRALSLAGDDYAPPAATEHLLACAGLPPTLVARVHDERVTGHFDWLRAPEASAVAIAQCLRSMPGHGRAG